MGSRTNADSLTEAFEKATEQVVDLADKATANARKAGLASLDGYEKLVLEALDSYDNAAAATNSEWAGALVSAQTGLGRELTAAFVTTAREHVG